MNKYEALYILANSIDEAGKESLIEKYSKVVTDNGGQIEGINKWGAKKLSYPINFKSEGYYVLMTYFADSKLNAELERQFLIAKEEVYRFMIVKKQG